MDVATTSQEVSPNGVEPVVTSMLPGGGAVPLVPRGARRDVRGLMGETQGQAQKMASGSHWDFGGRARGFSPVALGAKTWPSKICGSHASVSRVPQMATAQDLAGTFFMNEVDLTIREISGRVWQRPPRGSP